MNQVDSGRAEVAGRTRRSAPRSFPDLTVHADPRTGLPSELFNRVRPKIEDIKLPSGYRIEWGGEYEDSAGPAPAWSGRSPRSWRSWFSSCVCLFNSIRTTLLMWLVMPVAVIGVTTGLLLAGMPFDIHGPARNPQPRRGTDQDADRRREQGPSRKRQGKTPYQAIIDAGMAKIAAGVHGRINDRPGNDTAADRSVLRGDGRVHHVRACRLRLYCALIVTPVTYAIFYNIQEPTEAEMRKTA